VKLSPELVVFDVDGVLVDVHGSFHRSIVDTVRFFTGHRLKNVQVSAMYDEIHNWKNRTGYNDDWRLTTDWIASLGEPVPYETVKEQFQKFYWGTNKIKGNVTREKWHVTRKRLERWAERANLALFTGRTLRELKHTLDAAHLNHAFQKIVTIDDVKKGKPDPEGLLILLDGMAPEKALYLGDNMDDALSAQHAKVPFLGVLPHDSEAHRARSKRLRELGALAILDDVKDLEKFWA
jgi:HAD superfamily phosphatase